MCYGYNKLATMQGAKDFYEDNIGDYDEAIEEAWGDYIINSVHGKETPTALQEYTLKFLEGNYKGAFNAQDLSDWLLDEADTKTVGDCPPEFALELKTLSENLEDFEFPDEDEWVESEYEETLGYLADQCYEEARDRALGL